MEHGRRTKIVCTIGPASSSPETMEALVDAGLDAARLNFSHGTHEQHERAAANIRHIQSEQDRPLALIADLQGPKLRIAGLDEPRLVAPGDDVALVGESSDDPSALEVRPAVLTEALRPGHDVLIDDGRVRLRVVDVLPGRVQCTTTVGGRIEDLKGVNLPGVALPIPCLTDKDIADLEFAIELGVDYVALSFVRSPEDVRRLRNRLEEAGSQAQIIAKIEKSEAVSSLSAIIEEADGVMVARGDLGVEVGPAAVPLLQKRIIREALERGKTPITATQMLESMLASAEPTRAEASDVANAILDGTAAVMLSGETAIGEYPVASVAAMDEIALAVEPSMPYRHDFPRWRGSFSSVTEAVTHAACDMAELLNATAILVPTASGVTANEVARQRPARPVIALSHRQETLQRLALEWGVVPRPIGPEDDIERRWIRSVEAALETGLVFPGDQVIITAGTSLDVPGTTSLLKVETI
jgi:pyruvate kinase